MTSLSKKRRNVFPFLVAPSLALGHQSVSSNRPAITSSSPCGRSLSSFIRARGEKVRRKENDGLSVEEESLRREMQRRPEHSFHPRIASLLFSSLSQGLFFRARDGEVDGDDRNLGRRCD